MKYLILLTALIALPSRADDTFPVRYNLPEVDTEHRDTGDYKCLSTEQWKRVLLIANDYKGLYDWRLKIQGTLDAHALLVVSYEATIKNLGEQIKEYKRDSEYWQLRLKQTEEAKADAVFESKLEKYGYLVAIVLETGIIAYMGVQGLAD